MPAQQQIGEMTNDSVSRNMQGQPNAVKIMAMEMALSSEVGRQLYDPLLDGVCSSVRYDRTYFCTKLSPRCCRFLTNSPPTKRLNCLRLTLWISPMPARFLTGSK